MPKNKFLAAAQILVFFVLIFLLLKENEGRTAAEEKLRDMQYKVDALGTEKENVINELETRVAQLEGMVKESEERYTAMVEEKDAAIKGLDAASQEEAARHGEALKEKADEISALETRSQEEAARLDVLLKEKNAEIHDLSARLEEAFAKTSSLLKKIETLESEKLGCESRAADLAKNLNTLNRRNTRLAEIIKNNESRRPSTD